MTRITHYATKGLDWPTEELTAGKPVPLSFKVGSDDIQSDYPLTPETTTGQTESKTENSPTCSNTKKTERMVRQLNARVSRLYNLKDYSQALPFAKKAQELSENCLPENSFEYQRSFNNLALCLDALGACRGNNL